MYEVSPGVVTRLIVSNESNIFILYCVETDE